MDRPYASNRMKLDAIGIALSALCAVHCVLTIVIITSIGLASHWLLSPELHRWGLAAATLIAGIAIGMGVARHRRWLPLAIASVGLALMGGALLGPHGTQEALLTISGVALVSVGHLLNLRRGAAMNGPDGLCEKR